MQKVQTLEFLKDLPENGLVLLKFGAKWCSPCTRMLPILHQLELEFAQYQFYSIDIESDKEIVKAFQIKKVPTLVILKNGKEVNRVIGMQLIQPLRTLLRKSYEEEK